MPIARFAAGLLTGLLFAAGALAQAPADSEAAFDLAPVTLDGRVLFELRGTSSLPAEDRAATVSARIEEAAVDPEFDPQQIEVLETAQMSQVIAGQRLFLRVLDADAEIERIDRNVLATILAQGIRDAISDYREQRRPEQLARGAITVAVATVVLVAAIFLLSWMWRRLGEVMERRLKPRIVASSASSLNWLPGAQVWNALAALAGGLRFVALLLAAYLYAHVALTQFPQTRAIGERLGGYLMGPLRTMGRAFVDELPSLLFLVVLIFVTRFVLHLLRLYFNAINVGKVGLASFRPEWAVPTFRLVRIGVIAFALVVAYPYVPGSGSEAFKGLSIFFGVLLSIGSSSFVANSIAGYALIYRRLFAIGNRVRIGDMVGKVLEMGLQVTRLRTIKNEEVIVPNSTILNSVVINYSTHADGPGLILHTTVGIGYETPWRQVEGMLVMAASRSRGILAEPAPFVLQRNLGDFCVSYELNAYTASSDGMAEKYHSLHANILDVFNEYGVQIMTPAYEGDPSEPKVVPKERWYQEPSLPPAVAVSGGPETPQTSARPQHR